jgi:hypothetical protein
MPMTTFGFDIQAGSGCRVRPAYALCENVASLATSTLEGVGANSGVVSVDSSGHVVYRGIYHPTMRDVQSLESIYDEGLHARGLRLESFTDHTGKKGERAVSRFAGTYERLSVDVEITMEALNPSQPVTAVLVVIRTKNPVVTR